jgi:hypothetical protein
MTRGSRSTVITRARSRLPGSRRMPWRNDPMPPKPPAMKPPMLATCQVEGHMRSAWPVSRAASSMSCMRAPASTRMRPSSDVEHAAHLRHVEHDAAFERHALAVVAGAAARTVSGSFHFAATAAAWRTSSSVLTLTTRSATQPASCAVRMGLYQ